MMQYLDFSHASTSRKWTNKRQPGEGFDAPRNSLEFAMEAPHSYGVFQEDASASYSCNNNMRQHPKASAPIKKLIHEDISFRSSEGHKRVPSVIARLMGMDSPPLNSATGEIITTHSDDRRQETTTRSMSRRERDPAETIATKHVSFVQQKNSARYAPKQEIRALDDEEEREILGQLRKTSSSGAGEEWSKQPPREHPQEEELQKFKKEFAAWQANKVREQSRALELDYRHVDEEEDGGGRCSEIVPYRYHQQEKQHRGGRDGNSTEAVAAAAAVAATSAARRATSPGTALRAVAATVAAAAATEEVATAAAAAAVAATSVARRATSPGTALRAVAAAAVATAAEVVVAAAVEAAASPAASLAISPASAPARATRRCSSSDLPAVFRFAPLNTSS